MPERIACRQVSENSRTLPPFEKGGSGGISHEKGGARGGLLFSTSPGPLRHYPIHLLHHRFRFYHYLTAVKIPPAPFTKGGDIRGFAKGGRYSGFYRENTPPSPRPSPPSGGEGMIFMSGGDQIPVMMVCERGRYSEAVFGSYAGKDRMPASFRKQQNIPPPLKKGGQGGISIGRNSLNPPGPLYERGRYSDLW
jgi:hypothetical protein